jgi:hypothetical protein
MRRVSWLKAVTIVLLALTLATQVFAAQRHQHPALGTPAVQFGVLKFYAPWQGVQWAWWWLGRAPQLFLVAGLTFLVVTGGLLWLCQRAAVPEPVLATWATPSQLRRAKLLRRRGVVVGRLP